MGKGFDVLVVGEINPDLILYGSVEPAFGQAEKFVESAILTVGSSSVIFACAAARLGLRVAFVGKCGDDLFGQFMLAEMSKRGVATQAVKKEPQLHTGLSVILNRGDDRAILTYLGAIESLGVDDVPEELMQQSQHLHVASIFLQRSLRPHLPSLFHRAHSLGLTVSLDTNYDPHERWEGVWELLPLVDVFMPNAAEARALTGAEDVEVAVARLAESGVKTVAVKLGSEGALGWQGGKQERVPSLKVNVVDTVGAGDNFDAGFLYGYLNGWSLRDALKLGVVCGALSTRAAGGVAAQATLEEAMAYFGAVE